MIEAVAQVAKARGVPRAQIALAWVAQKRGVIGPIVGASKPVHLDDAVAALSLDLTDEEIEALEAPNVAGSMRGARHRRRHCEERSDDAIQSARGTLDCVAALAMTMDRIERSMP